MWALGNYFDKLGGDAFYAYAANFWRYHTARKGFAPAEEWLAQWLEAHPKQRMPSVLGENIPQNVSGKVMYCVGFLSFDANRNYYVWPADEHGVVVVRSYCCEDAPDETGFGRKAYYDWWLLDENLKQIPGTTMVDCLSDREYFDSPDYHSYRAAAGLKSGISLSPTCLQRI